MHLWRVSRILYSCCRNIYHLSGPGITAQVLSAYPLQLLSYAREQRDTSYDDTAGIEVYMTFQPVRFIP